jgi:hypothetical protein
MNHIAPKCSALFLAAICAGAGVWAQEPICSMEAAEAVPVFETAKALFRKGDYLAFYNLSTPLVLERDAKFDTLMGGIAQAVPDGFEGCATVLQRRDDGGMVQEVSLFLLPEKRGTIGLYMMAAPLSGDMRVIVYSYSTDIGEVLSSVR